MTLVNSCLLWGGQHPFVSCLHELVLFTRELLHVDESSIEN